jgi:hypothetical protein
MKKTIPYILKTLLLLPFLWIALSFVDIIADNCTAQPVHSEYNFFILADEFGREARR